MFTVRADKDDPFSERRKSPALCVVFGPKLSELTLVFSHVVIANLLPLFL